MDHKSFELLIRRERQMRKIHRQIASAFVVITLTFLLVLGTTAYISLKSGIYTPEKHFNSVWILFAVGALCMALASAASFYIVRMIFTPMEQLSDASLKVADGDFNVQVSYDGHIEELQNTIANFNRMVKELNSVEIMRNDFIADVSHEFKTPLAAITGYATFLQDPELTEEEKNEYIRKIFFNADKLNELTENILHLSKLEHQQFLDEPVTYRLDEQLRETFVLLEPKWSKKNMQLELDMPEVTFVGQKGLLFQVWMNLIGNAIKYSDENGLIQVRLKEKETCYEVIVRDEGIGMSEETQRHIFDKFYQADTSRKSQGNGLGLALCKEIIDKCHGKIVVESKEGVGSTFLVQLPK